MEECYWDISQVFQVYEGGGVWDCVYHVREAHLHSKGVGTPEIWEVAELSAHFSCKPKISLKSKVN